MNKNKKNNNNKMTINMESVPDPHHLITFRVNQSINQSINQSQSISLFTNIKVYSLNKSESSLLTYSDTFAVAVGCIA